MDIQVASNFERLYFEAVGRDAVETAPRLRRPSPTTGAIDMPPQACAAMRDAVPRRGGRARPRPPATIAATLNETGELIDPHTAVGRGRRRARRTAAAEAPLVVLSTAHPAKFPEAVEAGHRRQAPALPRRAPRPGRAGRSASTACPPTPRP